MTVGYITPAEYGRKLAQITPPITDVQAEAAARLLATVEQEAA